MVAYPVLKRSSVVKEHEFDDVRYTMALLLAMGKCKGVALRELVGLLKLDQRDMDGLIEDAACNHSLPFPNAVSDMFARFGSQMVRSPSLPMSSWSRKRKYLRFWSGSSLFNSERSESTALYDLVEDGILDWLESDDFKKSSCALKPGGRRVACSPLIDRCLRLLGRRRKRPRPRPHLLVGRVLNVRVFSPKPFSTPTSSH